jgi:hydroxypyruvate reductase
VPDENGVNAAREALQVVEGLKPEQTVVFLVSGGGSALFELPLPGVTLLDIADVTKQLLACGAGIVEINTIRKHLSQVKGGRFALRCQPAQVLSIVLSDVLGDPLDSIASGPAYPDSSTGKDAMEIVRRYGLRLPPHLLDKLSEETPKSLPNVLTEVTGNVQALCQAAMEAAGKRGYAPLLLTTTLDIEAREAGGMLAAVARQIQLTGQPVKPPCALILGGETVVHLRGQGKGGRNQELALAAAKGIDGLSNVAIVSVGSDGTDGPTDAAGGLVTGEFAARCREMNIDLDGCLEQNDSYHALKAAGGLLVTGPTGTNVNDLMMVLCR